MKPYGCHNSERAGGRWVKDGLSRTGTEAVYRMRYILDRASPECRYDQRKTDAKCEGCNR